MAKCPHCEEAITPKRDCSATIKEDDDEISDIRWIRPECEAVFGVSEVDSF